MGDFASAASGFTRTLELAPDLVSARLNRADAYLRLGRPERAIPDYDRALELQPDLAPAYAGRARAWLMLGNRSRAMADALRAKGLGYPVDESLLPPRS
jgi:tetratricopeptide (TPR) repeat protein